MTAIRTTCYVCCDDKYLQFIPLFICSVLSHNDDVFVEIGVSDMTLDDEINKALSILEKEFPNRFLLTLVDYNPEIRKKITNGYPFYPGSIRFMTEPQTKNSYVYIGDIDIICLQNISQMHIDHMEKTNLPYSNIIRPNSNRMSGLHFTKWENYYPIINLDNNQDLINALVQDEIFLYKLIENRGYPLPITETFRPQHGIHISLNRTHDGLCNWGIKNYISEWLSFRNKEIFRKIEPFFSSYIKNAISIIDSYNE